MKHRPDDEHAPEVFLLGRPAHDGADHEVQGFELTEDNWESTLADARAYVTEQWGTYSAYYSDLPAIEQYRRGGSQRALYSLQRLGARSIERALVRNWHDGGADPLEVYRRHVIPEHDSALYRRRGRDNKAGVRFAVMDALCRYEQAVEEYVTAIREGTVEDSWKAERLLKGHPGQAILRRIDVKNMRKGYEGMNIDSKESRHVKGGGLIDPAERSPVRQTEAYLREQARYAKGAKKQALNEDADLLASIPTTVPDERIRAQLMTTRELAHTYVLFYKTAKSTATNALTGWLENRRLSNQPNDRKKELAPGSTLSGKSTSTYIQEHLARELRRGHRNTTGRTTGR